MYRMGVAKSRSNTNDPASTPSAKLAPPIQPSSTAPNPGDRKH